MTDISKEAVERLNADCADAIIAMKDAFPTGRGILADCIRMQSAISARVSEVEAALKATLEREAETYRRHDARAEAAEAKLTVAREALEIVADGHSKDYTDNHIMARQALATLDADTPTPMRCAECDCGNPPDGCNWIKPGPLADTPAPHSDDLAVDRFAAEMKAKLAKKRAGGRGGWDDPNQCTPDFLRRLLWDHMNKGDPVDVSNFCMMLAHHGEATTPAPEVSVGEVTENNLPREIMCWNDSASVTRAGTWATTRYPEYAVAYVPKSDFDRLMSAADLGLKMAEANDLWNTAETILAALRVLAGEEG